ncbi:MAG: histidine phosphatase family protein [Candidatus Omnitrophota bacterium]
MKKIFLLRHAEAVFKSESGGDSARALTAYGKRQAADAARDAKSRHLAFDAILSSPFLRASQTAEIFADAFEMRDRLFFEPLLACGCSYADMKKLIEIFPDAQTILCVGHEPDFGVIAAAALGLARIQPLMKAQLVEIAI